jgi:hypothetical protein
LADCPSEPSGGELASLVANLRVRHDSVLFDLLINLAVTTVLLTYIETFASWRA